MVKGFRKRQSITGNLIRLGYSANQIKVTLIQNGYDATEIELYINRLIAQGVIPITQEKKQYTMTQESKNQVNNIQDQDKEEYCNNNHYPENTITFKTEFQSDECFKIFKIRNIEICLDNPNTLIMTAEACDLYESHKFCLSPKSWLITSYSCMTDLQSYLKLCLETFELKKFTPCNSLDETQLISGDIKQTKIQYAITTSFSSYRCFEEFAKKYTKICWQNTDIQVIAPNLLTQHTDDIYSSVSPWEITKDGCIEEPNYFDICIEAFAEKGIVLCELEFIHIPNENFNF